MTTAGFECGNSCDPVSRWYAVAECVLIGATVDFLTHQLFGVGVRHRSDRHVSSLWG